MPAIDETTRDERGCKQQFRKPNEFSTLPLRPQRLHHADSQIRRSQVIRIDLETIE